MNKLWCVFYAAEYKGGELFEFINISSEEVISIITHDFDFLWNMRPYNMSDEELYKAFEDWYSREEEHQLYAGWQGYTEHKVYSIQNGRLELDFPTKEEIIKALKNYIVNFMDNN